MIAIAAGRQIATGLAQAFRWCLINVIYAWVILVFRSSFVKIICMVLQFMSIFFDYAWFLLVRVLDLHISSQVLGENKEVEAKSSQES